LYETVFHNVLKRCRLEAKTRKRKFRFKHKLLSLDSKPIPLCLSVFGRARYKRAKGAVKLHMVLDHDGYLPGYAVVTDAKTADITAAKRMTFAPDTMLVFDRGYADHSWWLQLTRQQVLFVTRLKDSVEYGIVEQLAVPEGKTILRDEVILLCSQQDVGPEACARWSSFGQGIHAGMQPSPRTPINRHLIRFGKNFGLNQILINPRPGDRSSSIGGPRGPR
jgi:hypothetical protein